MTDLEISRALALAIGWPEVISYNKMVWVRVRSSSHIHRARFQQFDYRDWAVAGPIAEKFDCFPKDMCGVWTAPCVHTRVYAETPQKAIALAVIGSKKC